MNIEENKIKDIFKTCKFYSLNTMKKQFRYILKPRLDYRSKKHQRPTTSLSHGSRKRKSHRKHAHTARVHRPSTTSNRIDFFKAEKFLFKKDMIFGED